MNFLLKVESVSCHTCYTSSCIKKAFKMNHLMNLIHLNNTQELLGQTWHKIEELSIPQLDCWQVSPFNVFIRIDIFSSSLRPNIVPLTSTCIKQDTDQLRPVRKSRHLRYISVHRQPQIYTKLYGYQKITHTQQNRVISGLKQEKIL